VKLRKLNNIISSKINRSSVLALINQHPLISRAQLAQMLGFDRSTITHILNFLLKEGLVEEVKKGEAGSRGGRCPILLQIRYDTKFILAIEVDTKKIEGILTNLKGEEVFRLQKNIRRGEPLLNILTTLIDEFSKKAKKEFQRVAVIGISCPGVINSDKGIVCFNSFHNWRDIEVAETLIKKYSKPAFIENDANSAGMGELQQFFSDGINSLVYLFIRESPPESEYLLGVGGAIIINGKLWQGANYFAGEVAHTVNSLFQKVVVRRLQEGKNKDAKEGKMTLSYLLNLATMNDETSTEIIDEIADNLGKLFSEIVAFLDPEGIMIYIHPPQNKNDFLIRIQKKFNQHLSPMRDSPSHFLYPRLGSRATLQGLIALAQEKIFVRDSVHKSLLF